MPKIKKIKDGCVKEIHSKEIREDNWVSIVGRDISVRVSSPDASIEKVAEIAKDLMKKQEKERGYYG